MTEVISISIHIMTTEVLSLQLVSTFRTLDRDWRRRGSDRGGVIRMGGALEEGGFFRELSVVLNKPVIYK